MHKTLISFFVLLSGSLTASAREPMLCPTADGSFVGIEWPASAPHPVIATIQKVLTQAKCLPHSKVRETAGTLLYFPNPEASLLEERDSYRIEVEALHNNQKTVAIHANHLRGQLYGLTAMMEQMGIAFLHPLQPFIPPALKSLDQVTAHSSTPRWPERGIHLHTMHPTELAHLLNGWGPEGINDERGFDKGLGEWQSFLLWAIAQGLNQVEWVLLESKRWLAFSQSDLRQKRLTRLVSLAKLWGLEVGIDAPLSLQQQNAWRLVPRKQEDHQKQMHARIDWLMAAGFDFLNTEMGSTEFTNTGEEGIIDNLNEFSRYLRDQHDSYGTVKIHISSNQFSKKYLDPESGKPLNFNFLPIFTDHQLGLLPHTVQHYALDDPAPTYGNENFHHIRTFIHRNAGKRRVLFYPETAYWVSFDTDVPLFLPVYAQRRLHDLRLLANDEDTGMMRPMNGQIFFSSGWEWGYWLNDVVAARASWNPKPELASLNEAFAAILTETLHSAFSPQQIRNLVHLAQMQHQFLIKGDQEKRNDQDVRQRNGQAYLQGMEAADDLGILLRKIGVEITTQPDRLALSKVRNIREAKKVYERDIRPLLKTMYLSFQENTKGFEAIPFRTNALVSEIHDAAVVTALRAEHIFHLYEHSFQYPRSSKHIDQAESARKEAQKIVRIREDNYRVPNSRISSWRENPTVYPYRYLWATKNLYYWHRDEARAIGVSTHPCFRNTVNIFEVIQGFGSASEIASHLRQITADGPLLRKTTECLAPPPFEPLPGRWR